MVGPHKVRVGRGWFLPQNYLQLLVGNLPRSKTPETNGLLRRAEWGKVWLLPGRLEVPSCNETFAGGRAVYVSKTAFGVCIEDDRPGT